MAMDRNQLEHKPKLESGDEQWKTSIEDEIVGQFADSLTEQIFSQAIEIYKQRMSSTVGVSERKVNAGEQLVFEFDDLNEKPAFNYDDEEDDDVDDNGHVMNDDEESCETSTLDAQDGRSFSISPSRLDGASILRDLSEMSDCADRIDFILDQQDSPHYANSLSNSQTNRRSLSPAMRYQQQEDNDDDDEVD